MSIVIRWLEYYFRKIAVMRGSKYKFFRMKLKNNEDRIFTTKMDYYL